MPIQLPDARQLSDEALQVLRLRALRGIELGYTELDLADLLGVCNETISRWWTAYVADGLPSLPGDRSGRPLGSGRMLSDQQAERIKGKIDHHSPQELGIPHALWTRRAVRNLIRKEFDIDLAERTVGQYLRRWGYTSKKPGRHARQQNPDEVEQWLEETYPAIEEQGRPFASQAPSGRCVRRAVAAADAGRPSGGARFHASVGGPDGGEVAFAQRRQGRHAPRRD